MQFLFGIDRIFWMVVTVLTAMKERLRGAYLSLGVSKVGVGQWYSGQPAFGK